MGEFPFRAILFFIYSAMSCLLQLAKTMSIFETVAALWELESHISMPGPGSGKNHREHHLCLKSCLRAGRAVRLPQFPWTSSPAWAGIRWFLLFPPPLCQDPTPVLWDKSEDRPSCVMWKCVHFETGHRNCSLYKPFSPPDVGVHSVGRFPTPPWESGLVLQ